MGKAGGAVAICNSSSCYERSDEVFSCCHPAGQDRLSGFVCRSFLCSTFCSGDGHSARRLSSVVCGDGLSVVPNGERAHFWQPGLWHPAVRWPAGPLLS